MSRPALLNNVDHKELRIATARGAAFGDDVMVAFTFPAEFRDLQAHYPIVFSKSADGTSFHPLALLGLTEGENLFLDENGWDAPYIPLAIARQPFLIGTGAGGLTVHVDLDHPRAGAADGEPVFLPHGGNTEFLERASAMLLTLHEGMQATPAFVAALAEHALLESFVLDIEGPDGSQNRLAGFYTINEDRLAALGAAALERLHKAGYLQAIYMAVASLSQLRPLIERKQRRDAGHA